jgi:hypothetical protein
MAAYVERRAEVEAVQWDGSDEARDWILAAYGDGAYQQDEDIWVKGAMRDYTLGRDSWVVRGASPTPTWITDAQFTQRYEPK